MLSKLNNQRGFTLIEVIVAIAILGIIIAPLSAFFTTTIKVNADTRDRLVANHVAQKYMELAKNAPELYEINEGDPVAGFNDTGYYVEAFSMMMVDTYKYQDNDLPDFDVNMDIRSLGLTGGSITLEIGETQLKVPELGDKIYLYKNASSNPIRIGVICNQDMALTMNVKNTSSKRINLYKVMSNTQKNTDLRVETSMGEVYVYHNIYEGVASDTHRNVVYKITVRVYEQGASSPLTTLVGFETKK